MTPLERAVMTGINASMRHFDVPVAVLATGCEVIAWRRPLHPSICQRIDPVVLEWTLDEEARIAHLSEQVLHVRSVS